MRSAIAFSTNEQRSMPLDGARLLNLFPEQPPLGSRAPGLTIGQNAPIKAVLYGTPGIDSFVTVGSGKIRAVREALGYLWVLSDGALYRVDSAGSATLCTGAVIDPSGTAMLTDNGFQVVVLSNGSSFVVGTAVAKFSFNVTGGSYSTGVNEITEITVNGVSLIGATDVDWTGSNEQTAKNIAALINTTVSVPDYTAEAQGTTVIISAAAGTGTAPNGFAVVITAAGNLTVDALTGTMSGGSSGPSVLTQITSTAYASASSVDYMDGYIIWGQASSRKFFISALYDATALDALDFASAESTPTDLKRVLVSNRELWAYKADGFEVWANTGAAAFPFERIPGAVGTVGIAAPLSATDLNGLKFWLGNDFIVYMAQAYQPQRISTHGIEEIIRKAAHDDGVEDAFGMAYTQGGHHFYVLTFPSLGRTFVYDATDPSWHERQSGTTLVPTVWGVNCLTPAFGKIYAGTAAGKVGVLDLDTYDENGDTIRRVVVTPPFYSDGRRAVATMIEVEMELGVGLSAGQGSAPEIMLRWSDDGGSTWSNERRASIGATGVRGNRAQFRRLGVFRQRCYEISISDPVKFSAYGIRFEGMGLAA